MIEGHGVGARQQACRLSSTATRSASGSWKSSATTQMRVPPAVDGASFHRVLLGHQHVRRVGGQGRGHEGMVVGQRQRLELQAGVAQHAEEALGRGDAGGRQQRPAPQRPQHRHLRRRRATSRPDATAPASRRWRRPRAKVCWGPARCTAHGCSPARTWVAAGAVGRRAAAGRCRGPVVEDDELHVAPCSARCAVQAVIRHQHVDFGCAAHSPRAASMPAVDHPHGTPRRRCISNGSSPPRPPGCAPAPRRTAGRAGPSARDHAGLPAGARSAFKAMTVGVCRRRRLPVANRSPAPARGASAAAHAVGQATAATRQADSRRSVATAARPAGPAAAPPGPREDRLRPCAPDATGRPGPRRSAAPGPRGAPHRAR